MRVFLTDVRSCFLIPPGEGAACLQSFLLGPVAGQTAGISSQVEIKRRFVKITLF